jgi:purine-binding chemotaxis protein CheW
MMEKLPYLIFKLTNDVLYGFNITCVQEVIEIPSLKVLADMPALMSGFLEIRGAVIPVLDLITLFNASENKFYESTENIAILQNRSSFGVIIPEGSNVAYLEEIAPINQVESSADPKSPISSFLLGVTKYEDESVFILDPEVIFNQFHSLENPSLKKNIREIKPEDLLIFHERSHLILRKVEIKEAQLIPLVIIVIHGEYFGIDPSTIIEFCNMESYSAIPQSPPHIFGYINLRGNALLLFDIWSLLQEKVDEKYQYSQIIIIKKDDLSLGILVDSIVSVCYIHYDEFRPVPIGIKSYKEGITTSTAKYKQYILSILDIPKILNNVLTSKIKTPAR